LFGNDNINNEAYYRKDNKCSSRPRDTVPAMLSRGPIGVRLTVFTVLKQCLTALQCWTAYTW